MENEKIMSTKPYISFVVTARNDNYGGHFLNRLNSFVRVADELSQKNHLDSEIIVVEYNPPKNKKRLYEEMSHLRLQKVSIRFIQIPQSFHRKFKNSDKNPLFEYLAKNIGIRRAKGEYIIAMNPDIILSKELIEFISKRKLEDNIFYRVNRHDISLYKIKQNWNIDKILKECRKKTTKILYVGGTVYKSYSSWLYRFVHGRTLRSFMFFPLFNFFTSKEKMLPKRLHENAAGDFLLMNKTMWNESGGYDESPLGSAILDGYILYVLYCLGYKEQILEYPIYHIKHEYGQEGHPLASREKYLEDIKKMLKTKHPYKKINKNWGFPTIQFEEVTI